MKKGIFERCVFLLLFLVVCSCNTDKDDEASLLGTWIETAPIPERTTLVFGVNNRLTRIDGDGNEEVYNYRIEDKTLYLILASGVEGRSELFLEQINSDKLKTGNFYPSFPEAEPVFIIFERYN